MRNLLLTTGALLLPLAAGCVKVQHEVKEPIHIVADINVNVRVEKELDDFFAFEETLEEQIDEKDRLVD